MKLFTALILSATSIACAQNIPTSAETDTDKLMSTAYWKDWNPELQAKIDADIEANRKADAAIKISAKDGTEVRIEQETHDFIFGAHIFNFNQLGTKERNEKYKTLFGPFFNSATIAFYWKTFEPTEGKLRFETAYEDTEEFWNNCKDPEDQPHWRRPSTDQVVEFCNAKKIRAHGHPLVWGTRKHQHPEWLYENYKNGADKDNLQAYVAAMSNDKTMDAATRAKLKNISADELAKLIPDYTKVLNDTMQNRIRSICERYKDKIQSWDVCNESAADFDKNLIVEGAKITRSRYGLMPGDYPYQAFVLAKKYLPEDAKLNINDYYIKPGYVKQVQRLIERGAKIDIVGYQMHIFKPQAAKNIAEKGLGRYSSKSLKENLELIDKIGRPIHMSEITVPAPSENLNDQKIQAILASNFYRLWFSHKSVMGITWWNVVDGCGVKGEPSLSGMFTRDMQPKPAFHALNNLINKEWKTNTSAKVKNGEIKFRGFKGKYKLSWTDAKGKPQSMEYYLK